jgi:manganese transport protein
MDPDRAWRRRPSSLSLAEAHAAVRVPRGASVWRKLLAYAGPGFLVAVGYMDPGNWATGLAAGARYGYTLLAVILVSNLMAVLFQHLSLKLGIATGRDLAQACRDDYPTPVVWGLWVLCELAIVACDLAEVVGSAIALNLLFGIPIVWGCLLTALDVFVILLLQHRGFRYVEAVVVALIVTIGGAFAAELLFAGPDAGAVLGGLVPTPGIVTDPGQLFLAMGILGATVMPHNLYLHSAVVQTRSYERTERGRREAIRYSTVDSAFALTCALFINAAILIFSAAAFHWSGLQDVAELQDAYRLLSPMLGVGAASTLFAIALLASGQNATLTGTLAGQIVMEGFLNFRMRPWLRRIVTRLLAIVPAVVVIAVYGEEGTTELLVWSQVVLSLQLSFAVVPLLLFTGDRVKMGPFVNPGWLKALAWPAAALIIGLNAKLLLDFVAGGG